MDCRRYVEEARKDLKGGVFSKPDYDSAIKNFGDAGKCFEGEEDFEMAAECYRRYGELSFKLHYLKRAAEGFENAAKCLEKIERENKGFWERAALCLSELCEAAEGELKLKYAQKAAQAYQKSGNVEKAVTYLLEAATLSGEKNPIKSILYLTKSGTMLKEKKNYKDAASCFLASAKLWLEQNESKKACECYVKVAECYEKTKNFERGAFYYLKAAEVGREKAKYQDIIKYYWKAAECYENLKNYAKAVTYFIKGVSLAEEEKDLERIVEGYERAAECYRLTESLEKASNCFKKIAKIYAKEKNFLKAEKSYERAISLMGDIGMEARVGEIYSQIGEMWFEALELQKALPHYMRAIDFFTRSGKPITKIQKRVGECHEKIAENQKFRERRINGYKVALSFYEKAQDFEGAERVKNILSSIEKGKKAKFGDRRREIEGEIEKLKKDLKNNLLDKEDFDKMVLLYQGILDKIKEANKKGSSDS